MHQRPKCMVGRDAASQIASASLRSFLPRLTNGLTYCGGISRTVWPNLCRNRPQWWELPQASSTTSVGDSLAKNVSNRARDRFWRRIGRSCSSTPCRVKTDLDVSTAMRLNVMTGGSSIGGFDSPILAHDAVGAVHPNTDRPAGAVSGSGRRKKLF